MEKIDVIEILGRRYRDGGTKTVKEVNGERQFCIEHRFGTKTPGAVYDRYPGHKGAVRLDIEVNITKSV